MPIASWTRRGRRVVPMGDVKYDEELIERLMVYKKGLDTGGVLWTEPQVEFLKLFAEELGKPEAFELAVARYNAPPKQAEPEVQTCANCAYLEDAQNDPRVNNKLKDIEGDMNDPNNWTGG